MTYRDHIIWKVLSFKSKTLYYIVGLIFSGGLNSWSTVTYRDYIILYYVLFKSDKDGRSDHLNQIEIILYVRHYRLVVALIHVGLDDKDIILYGRHYRLT